MKENKPGFRFLNNDPELQQKWINACKRENCKPWNPSGKNVYICGDHFFTSETVEYSQNGSSCLFMKVLAS